MAKRSESFTLPISLKKATEACRRVFIADRWKVMDDSEIGFFIKERFDPISYMLHYPCKFAIFLHKDGGRKTTVELHGSMWGVTFLQTNRLKKMSGLLRERIEGEARQ